jgi:hypothetical protein
MIVSYFGSALNSASHRAITTDARQFPNTLTEVRAMSISSSIPRMMNTGSTGRWNDATVPRRITSAARGWRQAPVSRSAISAAVRLFSNNASSIAWPEVPNTSESTLPNLTLASSRTFWTRFRSEVPSLRTCAAALAERKLPKTSFPHRFPHISRLWLPAWLLLSKRDRRLCLQFVSRA